MTDPMTDATEAGTDEDATARVPLRVRTVHGDTVPRYPEECEPHTKVPRGYLAWDEWAERMQQTHVQRQCCGCGLWAIWEPKAGSLAAADPDGDDPARVTP